MIICILLIKVTLSLRPNAVADALIDRVIGHVVNLMELARSPLPTPFDENFFRGTIDMHRAVVQSLVNTCVEFQGLVGTAPDQETRIQIGGYARDRVSATQAYVELQRLVDVTEAFMTSVNHGLGVATLVLEAYALIRRYIFMEPIMAPFLKGWALDMELSGVVVPFHDFLQTTNGDLPGRSPFEGLRLFRLHLFATMHRLYIRPPGEMTVEDPWFLDFLARQLDQILRRHHVVVDAAFVNEFLSFICQFRGPLLAYIVLDRSRTMRYRAKLTMDLLEVLSPLVPLAERVDLVRRLHDGIPLQGAPIRRSLYLRLHNRDETTMITKSATKLLSFFKKYAFITGDLEIEYVDTGSVGDGVRRDWLQVMTRRYFKVWNGEPETRSNLSFWEYSNDSRSAIRPRSGKSLKSSTHEIALQQGLLICGALIGIGIRYGISLGVALSPSVILHLRDSHKLFDIDSWTRAEDGEFFRNLERLRSLSQVEFEQIRAELTEGDIVSGDVNEYIHRKKFERTVFSVLPETLWLKSGLHSLVIPGSLAALRPDELESLISGPREVTADLVIKAIDFPQGDSVAMHATWLMEILSDMSPARLVLFVKFVTGSTKPPALMADNHKWMNFQVLAVPVVSDPRLLPLPYSKTCFGALVSPPYPTKSLFETKLLQAISEGQTLEDE